MKAFKIPSLEEVALYISGKMPHWPDSFCQWTAEKFWNHYQACGWKLSSNVAMRDWQAAFNSNWKELRYETDRKKLEECIKMELQKPREVKTPDMITKINLLFRNFSNGQIHREEMASCYKWMKAAGMIHFTDEEMNKLVADAGNDKEYGRYLAVKLYFTKLLNPVTHDHE